MPGRCIEVLGASPLEREVYSFSLFGLGGWKAYAVVGGAGTLIGLVLGALVFQ